MKYNKNKRKNFETGGGGSSRVTSHQKVSPIDALREQVGDRGKIVYSSSPTAAAFKKADAVVVCTGFSYGIEGEFHDRPWRLPKKDRKLILKAAAHNPQTVVVLNSGGAVETEEWSASLTYKKSHPSWVRGLKLPMWVAPPINCLSHPS